VICSPLKLTQDGGVGVGVTGGVSVGVGVTGGVSVGVGVAGGVSVGVGVAGHVGRVTQCWNSQLSGKVPSAPGKHSWFVAEAGIVTVNIIELFGGSGGIEMLLKGARKGNPRFTVLMIEPDRFVTVNM
jgi:hypothetical protein